MNRRIPLNLFATALGITGLAGTWLTAADSGRAPVAVGDTLLAIGALTWAVVGSAYARYVLTAGSLVADLLDPVAAPFASLAVIVPMLLGAEGVYPYAPTAGRVLVDVLLLLTLLLGGWFTGQWLYAPMNLDTFHPGYFLPTVAGGFVASTAAAQVGQHRLGEVMFGLGVVCWLVLGSVIMGRLLFRPLLPTPLLPTYAIEVAPSAVASLAWFALHGGRLDVVASALGGYGLLMVIAQARLLPVFTRLPFMPSTWAFTFSWAAVASATLHWLDVLRPAGYRAWEYAVLAAISLLIGGIGVRTLVAMARRQLLPKLSPVVAMVAPERAEENDDVLA